MQSRNSRRLTDFSLRIVGTFSKVLKKDGSLLLKPDFKDNDFLLDFNYLYHFEFKTKWAVDSITKTAKGFQIHLKDVNSFKEAEYLIGEKFALPESEIFGKSQDLFIGMPVLDKSGKTFGKIVAFTPTPTYSLTEIESGKESVYVPFNDIFLKIEGEKIILIKKP